MNSKQVLVAYCAFPNETVAAEVSETLVAENIVACANIFPPMKSIYKWNGKTERESECAVIFKTTELKRAALKERIRAIHPYSVPGLIFLTAVDGLPEYLKWVYSQTL